MIKNFTISNCKTCMVGGSRSLFDDSILIKINIRKLNNILVPLMLNNTLFIVGDAYGADTSLQKYFQKYHYDNVLIYYVNNCRNNVYQFSTKKVFINKNILVDNVYQYKDIEMCNNAEFGIFLLDTSVKSMGTKRNIKQMKKQNKNFIIIEFYKKHITQIYYNSEVL